LDFRFTKAERISLKRDYDRAFREGRPFRTRQMTVFAVPNGLAHARLGLTVSRKIGKAVCRNLVKRRLREAFRLNKHLLTVPCDLVVLPMPGFRDVSFAEVEDRLKRIIVRVSTALAARAPDRA